MKKIFSFLIAICMLITAMPLTAHATQNTWDPANGVYDISTEADLLAFRDCLNNVNSNSDYYFENITVNLLQDITMTQTYVTASYITYDAGFCGTFDGHNHTISNINMVSNDNRTVGFLPLLWDGVVKDLTLENVTIEDGYNWVGVIAPMSMGSDSIINCHITGNCTIKNTSSFSANTFMGGIIGSKYQGSELVIENCSVGENVQIEGSTYNTAYVGGLVGFIKHTPTEVTVKNCINRADVKSDDQGAGIIGTVSSASGNENSVLIEDCINYGTISATNSATNNAVYLGGIAGQTGSYSTVQVNRCFNYGDIVSQSVIAAQMGGIISELHLGSVTNCSNAGDILAPHGSNGIGGIVGQPYINTMSTPVYIGGSDVIIFPDQSISIVNCYNTGDITAGFENGSTMIGGVCGNITGASNQLNVVTVNNCYNFGSINFTDLSQNVSDNNKNIGDICGAVRQNVVSDVYSKQNVKAIGLFETYDTEQTTCSVGYYDSTDRGGNIYPATMPLSGDETISETPIGTDLRTTLDNFVDEQNEGFANNNETFRYLPWTMSEGANPHPVFGYDVIVEIDEANKATNGGYVTASDYDVEYEKVTDADGETVTLTVHPNSGATLSSISVVDSEGNNVDLTAGENNTYIFEMPTSDVTVSATFSVDDTPHNAYYLTIHENIDVNFLIDTEYYDAEDGYIEYEYIQTIYKEMADRTDEPVTVSVAELNKRTSSDVYNNTTILPLEAAPAQIGEKYLIKVYDKNGVKKAEFMRSVEDYCNETIENYTSYPELIDVKYYNLATTVLNYGQLANEYFEYAEKHAAINGGAD